MAKMTFSEREGLRPFKLSVQLDSVSAALRSRLWNVLDLFFGDPGPYGYITDDSNRKLRRLFVMLWNYYFKKAIDEIPKSAQGAVATLKAYFFGCSWFEVYDLIEAVSDSIPDSTNRLDFNTKCNSVLEAELSGYRFVSGKIVEVTAKESIDAIESAVAQTATPFPTATQHLQAAISLLARRPSPDYRNTIKESISAVEAVCGVVTGETHSTLGKALKVLNISLHPALAIAFEKLYGYTSDADGIRHALMEEANLRQEDALFMLVSCSAFVSYIIAKSARKK
jgi:AbiJ N-terminal domain 4